MAKKVNVHSFVFSLLKDIFFLVVSATPCDLVRGQGRKKLKPASQKELFLPWRKFWGFAFHLLVLFADVLECVRRTISIE